MKKFISIYFFLCAMVAIPGAKAQEFIKSISLANNSNSIIRGITSTTWLYQAYDSGLSSFTILSSNFSHQAIGQLPFFVSDMTVESNNSFFCGIKFYPLFGYFSLNNFPNTTINTVTIEDIKPVDNIEAFYYGGNVRHVVLTGMYGGRNANCIIDAMQSYPFDGAWDVRIATNNGIDVNYHDVTVTSNHVVASGNINMGNRGYVVSYEKKQMHVGGFLHYPGRFIRTADSVYGKILLKAGIGDTVYAVYQSSANGNRFTVEEYKTVGSNITRIAGKRFTTPVGIRVISATIEDISFKNTNNSIDVLMWWYNNSSSNSTVWRISHSQLVSGGNIIGRNYEGHSIQSIDNIPASVWNIIASGYDIASGSMCLYKIYASSQGVCSTECESASYTISGLETNIFPISTTSITLYPEEETKTIYTVTSGTLCTANKTESDE